MVAAAAMAQQNKASAGSSLPPVAPDLAARLAKWKPVRMSFDSSHLTTRDRQMVEKLVEASQDIDDIFWRQSDPKGLELYKRLAGNPNPVAVEIRRLLMINGGRFDLIDNNTPFVGSEPYSPDAGLYPRGLTFAIMHEISHGLGPAFAHVNGKQADIRESIGPVYSGLEEAKADVVRMVGLKWLVDHGALKQSDLDGYYASYVAGIFRTVRYGTAEAHGQAAMMEFNVLSEQNAIRRDPSTSRYVIDYKLMPGALTSLAKVLLEIEAAGDRARAESWFRRYDVTPATLAAALKSASGVPVDVDPIFAFHVHVECSEPVELF